MDTMTIDEMQNSLLLVREQRMTVSTKEKWVMQTMVDEKNGRGRGRWRTRGRDTQVFKMDEIECLRCHKFRHFQYEYVGEEEKLC